MATSSTQICNLALGHLGEAPITSLEENTAGGRAAALHYTPSLEAFLREHRWNFATDREALTELAEEPDFGWDHQFQLPSDCLRVLEINDSEFGDNLTDEYIVEGGKILTDSDTVNIVYVKRFTDVSEFDALFVKAFALQLAIDMSESIRGASSKTEELEGRLGKVLPKARRVDANEGRRRKGLIPLNSHAIRARNGEIY